MGAIQGEWDEQGELRYGDVSHPTAEQAFKLEGVGGRGTNVAPQPLSSSPPIFICIQTSINKSIY